MEALQLLHTRLRRWREAPAGLITPRSAAAITQAAPAHGPLAIESTSWPRYPNQSRTNT